jgi:hypothetical protein
VEIIYDEDRDHDFDYDVMRCEMIRQISDLNLIACFVPKLDW